MLLLQLQDGCKFVLILKKRVDVLYCCGTNMKANAKKTLIIVLIVIGQVFLSAIAGSVAGWLAADKTSRFILADYDELVALAEGMATGTAKALPLDPDLVTTTIRLVPLTMLDGSPRLAPKSLLERQTTVGVIYAQKPKTTSLTLTEDDAVARAVAMTSDGWFVTAHKAIEASLNSNLYIWHNAKMNKVEKMILDSATDVVFLKIDASHVSVASFAKPLSGRTGVGVWLEVGPVQFVPSVIAAVRFTMASEVRSSDKLSRRAVAIGQMAKSEAGTPVWDANGALVGLIESGSGDRLKVIPGAIISGSLQSLMSNQKIEHASLGVRGVNVALVRSLDPNLKLPEKGVWLNSTDVNLPAIIPGAAGAIAGLKAGDVILQVDRDIIDETLDLGDIILQFVPGANVTLRVWRNGEELDIPATLGKQTTSKTL